MYMYSYNIIAIVSCDMLASSNPNNIIVLNFHVCYSVPSLCTIKDHKHMHAMMHACNQINLYNIKQCMHVCLGLMILCVGLSLVH